MNPDPFFLAPHARAVRRDRRSARGPHRAASAAHGAGSRRATAARRLLVAGFALVAAGCSPPDAASTARPLVAVSVVPQQYLVDRLAGELVRVVVMVPPGANPSAHEPSLAELRALAEASLYVKVGHPGFPFERAWLDRMLAERPELPVVDCAATLDVGGDDPHVWVVPRAMGRMAAAVAAALSERMPEHADVFAARLVALEREIDALDEELARTLAPARGRAFFVFHPAWGHLARTYGLEQVPIEQDHKSPSPRHVAEVLARARRAGARAVFVQPQFDAAPARTVAEALGAQVIVIDPLAYDWADNLRAVARRIAEASTG